MKQRFFAIVILLAVLITPVGFHTENVCAANKKANYSATLAKEKNKAGTVYRVSISGKKLMVEGSLSVKKSNSKKWSTLKYKKRGFKLASNCKFFDAGGAHAEEHKISKRRFLEIAKDYICYGLSFQTNKKGQVYKMVVY